jgi:hypothetical protein
VRPSERAAGVPEDLERLCVELMARDPSARPGGRELLARLRNRRPAREVAPVAQAA